MSAAPGIGPSSPVPAAEKDAPGGKPASDRSLLDRIMDKIGSDPRAPQEPETPANPPVGSTARSGPDPAPPAAKSQDGAKVIHPSAAGPGGSPSTDAIKGAVAAGRSGQPLLSAVFAVVAVVAISLAAVVGLIVLGLRKRRIAAAWVHPAAPPSNKSKPARGPACNRSQAAVGPLRSQAVSVRTSTPAPRSPSTYAPLGARSSYSPANRPPLTSPAYDTLHAGAGDQGASELLSPASPVPNSPLRTPSPAWDAANGVGSWPVAASSMPSMPSPTTPSAIDPPARPADVGSHEHLSPPSSPRVPSVVAGGSAQAWSYEQAINRRRPPPGPAARDLPGLEEFERSSEDREEQASQSTLSMEERKLFRSALVD